MANIQSFSALRFNPELVSPSQAVTQPYDKITAAMQDKYYAASPYNLIRIILGRMHDGDNTENNVYTRAASHFFDWRKEGVLRQDEKPCIYAYSERFRAPGPNQEGSDTEQERRGFIALGRIEDYSAGVVFRHEQTLAKPKADRLELLRATKAHFGQIFMLYESAADVDSLLVRVTQGAPDIAVTDEYGVVHRVWAISDPAAIGAVENAMKSKRLIIADGHHRYETALNYRNERRAEATSAAGANAPYEYLMMTFISMGSPELLILPTHRVVHGLEGFSADRFEEKGRELFAVEKLDGILEADEAIALLKEKGQNGTALLAVMKDRALLLHHTTDVGKRYLSGLSTRQQALDVVQLHKCLLEGALGLSEESIRNQQNISYLRDAGEAVAQVRGGSANIVFLMNPCTIEQMRDVAFAGEVMPQKSTDFYPKLLSGLTVYALE